jgi:hypothetical protein
MEATLDAETRIDRAHRLLLEALGEVQQVKDGLSSESLKLHANVHICLRDEHGNVKQEETIHNVICTAGKNKLLATSGGGALTAFSYIAIGTGTTAVSSSDTTLQTELARANGTTSNPTALQYQVVYTFPTGIGTGAITESGILDAASSGNLLCHQVFSAYNKGAFDTLTITWQIS